MIDIPDEAYEAAAVAIHDRECAEGPACTATPTSMTRYFELAKRAVDAAAPHLARAGRDQAAAEIRAHADKHAPKDGNRAQLTLRRHLFIAERVAAGPMTRAEVVEALNAMFGGEPQP